MILSKTHVQSRYGQEISYTSFDLLAKFQNRQALSLTRPNAFRSKTTRKGNRGPQRRCLFTFARPGVYCLGSQSVPLCHAWPKGSSILLRFRFSIRTHNTTKDHVSPQRLILVPARPHDTKQGHERSLEIIQGNKFFLKYILLNLRGFLMKFGIMYIDKTLLLILELFAVFFTIFVCESF